MAAGGATLAVLGRAAGGADGGTLPQLPATSGATIGGGAQRFHSRPDLIAPEVVIDTPARVPLAGVVVTETHLGAPQPGPVIIDQTGRIVWFAPVAAEPATPLRAFNVRVQEYQGQPVLCWFEGVVAGGHGVGYGQGHYRIVDSSYREIARVFGHQGLQGDLHEFFLTPEGTAIFSCYGTASARWRSGGGVHTVPYLYGVVQEVDVASGELLWYWRSDRHIHLWESYKRPVLKPGWIWDYLHLNSISVDPHDRNLIVSGRNTSACYKINRGTGEVMWRLGGKRSDFHLGPGARFNFQHDVEIHPDGVLTVFDNEGGPPRYAAQSRGLVLGVDERQRRVRLLRALHHRPPVYSDALGNVQTLAGGGWFVGWGRSTYFTQYSSTGEVQFDGHLGQGSSSYRAFLEPWSGTPGTVPAIAVTRSGTTATVYASWNGASELASWMVVGGPSAGQMGMLGRAPLVGFETAITVPSAPAYLAVAACSAGGQVLATSPPVGGA